MFILCLLSSFTWNCDLPTGSTVNTSFTSYEINIFPLPKKKKKVFNFTVSLDLLFERPSGPVIYHLQNIFEHDAVGALQADCSH